MLNLPLITTIIPTYRRPELLIRAIKSALNQTFQDLQVCVYDNASGDETAQVVKELAEKDRRLKYYCHPENIGAHRNFQYGLSKVETPYFSFLSDDDILLPDFYEQALKELSKFPDAAFFAGATLGMSKKGQPIGITLTSWEKEGYFLPPEAVFKMEGNHLIWTSHLFRTKFAQQIGGLDSKVGTLDTDFILKLAVQFPIIISKNICALFLDNSSPMPLDLKILSWDQMKENITNLKQIPQNTREKVGEMILRDLKKDLFSRAHQALWTGNFNESLKACNVIKMRFPETRYYWPVTSSSSLLTKFVKYCAFSRLFYRFIIYTIKSFRFAFSRSKRVNFQKKYMYYSKFIK